ncbi:hypothetical protein B0H66DRAFT_453825, partial [Apodospora peruviana]
TWTCQSKIDAVPECAVNCVNEAAPSVGCEEGDFECDCANFQALQSAAATCVVSNCRNIGTVINQLTDVCSCVNANPPGAVTPCPAPSSADPVTPSSSVVEVHPSPSGSAVITDPLPPSSSVVVPAPSSSATPPSCEPWTCEADLAAVPSCATPIIDEAAVSLGCAEGDHNCQCENASEIQGLVATDVIAACGIANVAAVLGAVEGFCTCVAANP